MQRLSKSMDELAWWLIGLDISNTWHPPAWLIGWAVRRVVTL